MGGFARPGVIASDLAVSERRDPPIVHRFCCKRGHTLVSEIKYGIAWNDSYTLEDDLVDSQHRRLFELLSELVQECEAGTNTAKLEENLDVLVNYTVQHFTDEEALQLAYNYPDIIRHKELHESFKTSVCELAARFMKNGSSTELSVDMNKIVARWLVNHIQIEDKKVGRHIREVVRQRTAADAG